MSTKMPEEEVSITVQVKLLGFLEQYTDRQTLFLQAHLGCTVADIIHKTVEQLGSDFRHALLDRHGSLNGGVEVVLDREHISAYKITNIKIWKDSELILIPMIAGGAA